ncbi:MAG TPA: flagellar motor switch protein FliG [Gammaproteobacteria bacterium]|uniref:flagellar motor switch protein FliG n=1 Tax=Immundisolibacter sp. TaxID=1934948 RepID=UPI000E99B8A9|nr:flagellar motor switch protein FliG [Gammaproteobacteria bacterium]HCZ48047.1 flagellar motor switch protein FliG [Gammaproteobacteria bacterium]MCH77485.1 flagellar motor switch protein FliG [Gammaproteobacteria bacterium]
MPEPLRLSGAERSAILIMALGERKAAEVLRQMEPKEVQRIGSAMTRLGGISRAQVDAVLQEFGLAVQSDAMLTVGVEDYLRNVMVGALGEQKARGILDRVLEGGDDALGGLKWMDPKSIAVVLRCEHPQVAALALASIEADQAALVLGLLPPDLRADIVARIATLDELQPAALAEVRAILEQHFYSKVDVKSAQVGGIKSAAGIVSRLDPATGNTLLEELREADEGLEQRIQDNLILFEHLIDVDDKGLQALLRETTSEVLLVALKGADPALRDRFFKNMSKRAAEMLREDMQLRGPVRLAEVEEAQKDMLAAARRLAEAGTIRLGKGGGDFVE